MGKKSSGSPPPAPDYVGAAREQGRINDDAARLAAELNRVNQVNPYGSITYSRDGDQWTQTTSLSPEQQQLYGISSQNAIDRANMAGGSGQALAQQLAQGIDFSGLDKRVGNIKTTPFQTDVNASSVAQRGVDLSGLPELSQDFSGERQRVEDALYGRGAERLDDQFSRREEDIRSQLMNQGIREGSEAWNNAYKDFENTRQDSYGDLRDRAILAGGQEQSRLFADALAARQQGAGEQFGLGDFANNAAQQEFQNEYARAGLYNAGQQAGFEQDLTNAGLTNSARDAGINEMLLPRQQMLNEYAALYGEQPNVPNAGVPTVGGPQPTDYLGAVDAQYGAEVDRYNAEEARRSNFLSNLYGLAGGLGSAFLMRPK